MKKKIIVQIPCLNEEIGISNVIKKIRKQIPQAKIIVYDNNSSDNTANVARKNKVEVRLVNKKGKGNVVRRMFSDKLDGDYFVMIDGDDTYELSGLKKMLEMIDVHNYDMIVGKRIHSDSSAYRKGHILGNRFFSKFVNIFFGKDITDIFSGFRIFSKRFVKTFPLNSREFEIEAEMTIHALEQRLSVGEYDCKYNSRTEGSTSKLNTYKDGIKILQLILILIKDEKPLLFFSLVSLIFFTLSMIIGIPVVHDWYITGLVEKFPSAILAGFLMIISFLSFFSGLILDIIKKVRFENKRMNFLLFKD
ncbi:MAG: glycosyltransferase family 2 protein [Pseudomonadota bacterium]|nr:glycosyltransferase family 2 protein [Pseudomonadota bacterium]